MKNFYDRYIYVYFYKKYFFKNLIFTSSINFRDKVPFFQYVVHITCYITSILR